MPPKRAIKKSKWSDSSSSSSTDSSDSNYSDGDTPYNRHRSKSRNNDRKNHSSKKPQNRNKNNDDKNDYKSSSKSTHSTQNNPHYSTSSPSTSESTMFSDCTTQLYPPPGPPIDLYPLPRLSIIDDPNEYPHLFYSAQSALLEPTALPNSLNEIEHSDRPVVFECTVTGQYFVIPMWYAAQHIRRLEEEYVNIDADVYVEYPPPIPIYSPPMTSQSQLVHSFDGSVHTTMVQVPHPAFINFTQKDYIEYNSTRDEIYQTMIKQIIFDRKSKYPAILYKIDSTTLPSSFLPPTPQIGRAHV